MRKYMIMTMKKSIYASLILIAAMALGFIIQACSSDDPTIGNPTVDSFTLYTDQGTPDAGPVGSLVKLTGTYFSAAGTNIVKFNGVEATVVTSKTATTSLTVIVPSGAITGPVSVTVGSHTGTSTKNFTVNSAVPAPAIIDYSPTSANGADGIELTINGVNFSSTPANNTVEINGVDAGVPTAASATSLTVIVPSGSTTGKITVEVDGATGTATSEKDFTVPTPSVASFTPTYSIPLSTVTITGTNFSKVAGNNVVKFNGVAATVNDVNVKDATANTLTVIVPAGATTGKITVDVDGMIGTSKDDFSIN
ncbi:MAG TPA: IPT/TIG domain-containing protein [Cyclobacteriaceae bacterium]|nr:IPT/TIG domain-containing protein [Cyclobacteriaceae bacterium]